jgi:hypothetical protein
MATTGKLLQKSRKVRMMNAELQMPTQEEILARFLTRKERDMFGDEVGEYLPYLSFEHAKAFLKEGVTKEEWDKERPSLERDRLLKQMEEYMEFGWEKANNCRGLSANRTMAHYVAWTWLAGDRAFSEKMEAEYRDHYQFYGKDILVMICKHYGWDSSKWDNGRRQNGEYE